MKQLIISIVFLLLSGCYNQFGNEIQHYLIQKNKHEARLSNQSILEKYTVSSSSVKFLSFEAVFGDGCDYSLDYKQINKLYGLSSGVNHHKYSARIGWMYNTDTNLMDIYGYWYIDGVRDFKYITSVPTHTWITYYVGITDSGYTFTADHTTLEVYGRITNKKSYRLFPYFGGKEPAPNDMRIAIKE